MPKHTEISERDGISAVRRHLEGEHGTYTFDLPAARTRALHERLHNDPDYVRRLVARADPDFYEAEPQNPPMPDLPVAGGQDWIDGNFTIEALDRAFTSLPRFDAEAAYVRWAEANPGEAMQNEYDRFEADRDREDRDV